jgi:hypothetical protein
MHEATDTYLCSDIQHISHIRLYFAYPKYCVPGLPAAGRQGLRLHILQFCHILYFFAHKTGELIYIFLHIMFLHIGNVKIGGDLYSKGGVDMQMGISYFIYSIYWSYSAFWRYSTYSAYLTNCAYSPYSTYLFICVQFVNRFLFATTVKLL